MAVFRHVRTHSLQPIRPRLRRPVPEHQRRLLPRAPLRDEPLDVELSRANGARAITRIGVAPADVEVGAVVGDVRGDYRAGNFGCGRGGVLSLAREDVVVQEEDQRRAGGADGDENQEDVEEGGHVA